MLTYLLLIHLVEGVDLKIGNKGYREFKRGYYIYAGSGKRFGFQRIIRHIKKSKKRKWHIDYLLEKGDIERIWIIFEEKINECKLSELLSLEKGKILMRKFGSSDCKCASHLFYFKKNPLKIIENIINPINLKN